AKADCRPEEGPVPERFATFNSPQEAGENSEPQDVAQGAQRESVDCRQAALGDREHRRPAEDADPAPGEAPEQIARRNCQAAFFSSRNARRRILPTLVLGS